MTRVLLHWTLSDQLYSMTSLLTLLLLSILSTVYTTNLCGDPPQDDHVYSFSSGNVPYSYINEDGKMAGTHVDLVRYICEVMNKKCVFAINHFTNCWNSSKASSGLNNAWWDVCIGVLQTAERRSAYGFVAEFTKEPPTYVYVRKGSGITTVDDFNFRCDRIGFMKGWWTDSTCLEKFLGTSLKGKTNIDFLSPSDMFEAMANNQLDAMFISPTLTDEDFDDLERLDIGPIYCAVQGNSMMVRKDKTHQMNWIQEGLDKLRANGDFKWLCNLAKLRGAGEICIFE